MLWKTLTAKRIIFFCQGFKEFTCESVWTWSVFWFSFFGNSLMTFSILGFKNPFLGLIWMFMVSQHPLQSSFHIHLHRALKIIFYETRRCSIWVCVTLRVSSSPCSRTAWKRNWWFQRQSFPMLKFPSRIKHFVVMIQTVSSRNSDHRIYHWEGHQEMIWTLGIPWQSSG